MFRKYKVILSLCFALLFSVVLSSFSVFADDSSENITVTSSLFTCDQDWVIVDELFSVSGFSETAYADTYLSENFLHQFSLTNANGSALESGYSLEGHLRFFYYQSDIEYFTLYLGSCIGSYIELIYSDGSVSVINDNVIFNVFSDGYDEYDEYIELDFFVPSQSKPVKEICILFKFDGFNFDSSYDEIFSNDDCRLSFGFIGDVDDPCDYFDFVTSFDNSSGNLLTNIGTFFGSSIMWLSTICNFIVSNSLLLILVFFMIVSGFVIGLLDRTK